MSFPPIRFAEPIYLWLLVLPGVLLVMWGWQLIRRRRDVGRCLERRMSPVRERYAFAGWLSFWWCLILAVTLVVVALARPQAFVSSVQRAGVDFVILQDGSASMRVADEAPDRWQRAIAWLRTFAGVLSWTDERVALALFAHRAAPQVRLTRDPNAFFFFLDHLQDAPPFRLEDDTSWDTNIEEGIQWGIKMIDKDEELYGRRRNARAFIIISDGQAWSGEVSRALELARDRRVAVYVVGVGTSAGGFIPQLPGYPGEPGPPPLHSTLDRSSLRAIAKGGGGRYFELGAEPDHIVALKILTDAQRMSEGMQIGEVFSDLYWRLLAGAAGLLCLGALLLRERTQLTWLAASATAILLFFL